MRPKKKQYLFKTMQSTQIKGSQQLAQEYGRFGIKIRQNLVQDLVNIRSRCVPHPPNLDILKRLLSVREWSEISEGVIAAYEICRVTTRFARLTATYQAWFHNDDVI
ncbi:MAG: hypothetical protein HON04_10385 [Planctomicrobium sp.]|nr:hypothetical protein [Planctomicrobium sp.]